MANLKISWVLPTLRTSGKPLAPADIDHALIEVSADLGANWSEVGAFPPAVLETTLQDVDFGEWQVRGTVFDTKGRASNPVTASIVNEDVTPPGELALTLTFV